MAMQVRIERFAEADIAAVQAIDAQVYARPWSAALLADDIVKDNRHHLVARHGDGRVMGHASVMVLGDEGHISTVAVDPVHQRRGIARRLVLALCQIGMAQNLSLLTLEVRASNRAAQRLYSSFGFAPVGVRPRYYEPDREDALILTAHDIASADFAARLERQSSAIAVLDEASESDPNNSGHAHD